jgi:nicotinamidase-related amidase
VHCVQDTEGAALHPGLDTAPIDAVVDKGQDPGTDGYSGFEATGLAERLRDEGVDEVTIVGLATDYCVFNTARDALREGFGVRVDPAAVRGVNVEAGDAERALEALRTAGASVA